MTILEPIKRNDVGVRWDDTLTVDGVALDISGATVLFLMRYRSTLVSKTATVVSGPAGTVRFVSATGDLNIPPGEYKQEWQVTMPGGAVYTFPSGGYNIQPVLASLNDPV